MDYKAIRAELEKEWLDAPLEICDLVLKFNAYDGQMVDTDYTYEELMDFSIAPHRHGAYHRNDGIVADDFTFAHRNGVVHHRRTVVSYASHKDISHIYINGCPKTIICKPFPPYHYQLCTDDGLVLQLERTPFIRQSNTGWTRDDHTYTIHFTRSCVLL